MSAGQFELRVLVLSQRECGGPVSLQIVALIAAIFVWRACELAVVLVLVAVRTALEIDNLEDRSLALGNVAATALNLGVAIDERVFRFRMGLHIEQRRLPILHVVTGRTLDPFRTLCELSVVIVLMAVGAFRKSKFFLEVPFDVASHALHRRVLAEQGILGLVVIEIVA